MRKLVIAIMIALVTLVGVCLPTLAQPAPTPTDTPQDFWAYLNGTTANSSKIVDGVLVKDISLVCQGWGGKYKLDVQKGTKVRIAPKGFKVGVSALLKVYVSGDIVSVNKNCVLSGKPVTLYKQVGGEWVKLQDIK